MKFVSEMRFFLYGMTVTVYLTGCANQDNNDKNNIEECTPGQENCECRDDLTCDDGYVCKLTNNICMEGEPDGGTDTDTDSDGAVCGAEYFTDWDAGKSPEEIGLKLATLFNSSYPDQVNGPLTEDSSTVHYKNACTWYGALDWCALAEDTSLRDQLIQKYMNNQSVFEEYFSTVESGSGYVDQNVFGIVPLEVYLQNNYDAALQDGLGLADHQIANIDSQKRRATDDMFMITGLQVQAYRASGDAKYLDLAATTMVEYLAKQRSDGCFYQKTGAAAEWGRGNGWFATGMTEMLRELPTSHPEYTVILEGYKKMMEGLLGYQIQSGDGAGIWYQVIEKPDPANWPETSGSAMFTAAMITGVKMCILDADIYGPAARTAWLALLGYLKDDGRLTNISDWCYYESGDAFAYYTGRPKVTGDGHGQAPMLWAAAALMR